MGILRFLHWIGLTNLTDKQVSSYETSVSRYLSHSSAPVAPKIRTAMAHGVPAIALEHCATQESRDADQEDLLGILRVVRVEQGSRLDRILGESRAIRRAIETALSVARSSATSVLILGESGVGKELFARAIHGESPRGHGPFMEINCAAIPRELLESELFGHEKGAFTDATSQRIGLFEAAEHGTVFLDEISELPLRLQTDLLKALDQKVVRRVGGSSDIPVDVRILAATNRSLAEEMRSGRFREDLYYRLSVVQIEVPPLRERDGDIVLLARLFTERFARMQGRSMRLSEAGEGAILRYHWPGNVRELINVIERAVLLSGVDELGPSELALPALGARRQSV